MLRVEFHCHTIFSRDSLNEPHALIATARKRGIDRLVITDHNSIQGALLAKKIDPDLVIVGEEIKTTRGELLASFVTEEVPVWLEPKEAIRRLRDQGAFISVSHPFDLNRHGWKMDDLEEITPLVDAIEIFNARCMNKELNDWAANYALTHRLSGTAGSDAHLLWEVGRATLLVPDFDDPDELRTVIHAGKVDARLSPGWVHFGSTFATMTSGWRKVS